MVDVVLVVVGVAAMLKAQKMPSEPTFCTFRGTVGDVLRMLEDAGLYVSLPVLPRLEKTHRAHNDFVTVCAVIGAFTIMMTFFYTVLAVGREQCRRQCHEHLAVVPPENVCPYLWTIMRAAAVC